MPKLIASFQVDHTKIVPGIYVSRRDRVGDNWVTTFDIRMKRPNVEPALHPNAMHTIEHVVATYLRNSRFADKVVYWGPMGCLTGNYFLLRGDLQPRDILELMIDTFEFVATFDGEVPGAKPRDCGNWSLHDLADARIEERRFADFLKTATDDNFAYPSK